MKLISNSLVILLLAAFTLVASDVEVIAIGIGEKNSTLDESVFPNISVYYTPSIEVTKGSMGQKKFSGAPKSLTEWFNTSGEPNDFVVVGSNGVIYDQGKSIIAGISMQDVETERKGSFSKAVAMVADKGRTLRESKKGPDFKDEKGWVRRKLPSFTMTNPIGNSVSSSSVFDNGKPKLVLFFYLDPDTYIGVEKDNGSKARSKEYMRGRMESAGGVEGVRALIQVERELFNNIIHDIY